MCGWPSGNWGKNATQIISSSRLTARLNGRKRVTMETTVALWIGCLSCHHNIHPMIPHRKYCKPHASIRSLSVTRLRLFHERRLTHSCNANKRPNNVNAPTKATGFRTVRIGRFFIVEKKFSSRPCAFYAKCIAKLFMTDERKQLTGSIYFHSADRSYPFVSSQVLQFKRERAGIPGPLDKGSCG
jgi:hypothetical protein